MPDKQGRYLYQWRALHNPKGQINNELIVDTKDGEVGYFPMELYCSSVNRGDSRCIYGLSSLCTFVCGVGGGSVPVSASTCNNRKSSNSVYNC
jgi:hypothetical protein